MNEIVLQLDHGRRNRALTREWLLTNGLGGYAMGTALGVNSRRHHGLFVPATSPPVGRVVALHSVLIQLIIDGDPLDLSTFCFGGEQLLHPSGWRLLRRLVIDPPHALRWEWRLHSTKIAARLELAHSQNTAAFSVTVDGLARPAVLRVRPMTPLRDHHAIDGATDEPPAELTVIGDHMLRLRRGLVDVELAASAGDWSCESQWWRQFSYFEDRARGQEYLDDVWSPGAFLLDCEPETTNTLSLQVTVPGAVPAEDPPEPSRVPDDAPADVSLDARLRVAADQFIVRRPTPEVREVGRRSEGGAASLMRFAPSIIAGYPWFTDWGRDAMIALPGLMLETGRLDEAHAMLLAYAGGLRDGLIPNVFADATSAAMPAYNAADTSLWFVLMVHAVARAARDAGQGERLPMKALREAVRSIIQHHVRGVPLLGISIDPADGLLIAISHDGAPLTWMDARRGGVTFTRRDGKPVEMNALWINALHAGAELLAEDDPAESKRLRDRSQRAAESFPVAFWSDERGCLHDCLHRNPEAPGGWSPDPRLRPNQLFALSLPVCPLDEAQQRSVLLACREHLLTPFGLRTLAPHEPGYIGRFEGDLMQRDAAYHNGTVWPWLFGPFGDAMLRVEGDEPAVREELRRLLRPLIAELDRGCLGQLPEVFDGDAPHRPGGCSAQAWSVAEILRLVRRIDAAPQAD